MNRMAPLGTQEKYDISSQSGSTDYSNLGGQLSPVTVDAAFPLVAPEPGSAARPVAAVLVARLCGTGTGH